MRSTICLVLAAAASPSVVCEKLAADCFSRASESVGSISGNHPRVLQECQSFISELREALSRREILEHEVAQILGAMVFAAEKHKDQTRKDPERTPYIIHPIGVARHLFNTGNVRDPNILIGALLHDTVEDTQTTFEEIRVRFGATVEGYIREVTDDKSLLKEERKRLQIVNAHHKSPGAAQIKLGDKFYNLSDLMRNPPADWPRERIDGYFDWAKQVVDGLPPANPAMKEAVDGLIDAYWSGR